MATILLVEDEPDIGAYEAGILEDRGHIVLRCHGSPTPLARCPLADGGCCPMPDVADVIVFSCGLYGPVGRGPHRGAELVRAYRAHPAYGRIPFVVVAYGDAGPVPAGAPITIVPKHSSPERVLRAIEDAALAAQGTLSNS